METVVRKVVQHRGQQCNNLAGELLAYLLDREGELVPFDELTKNVFGYDYEGAHKIIKVHLVTCRRFLRDTDAPYVIDTIKFKGLRLRVLKNG